MAGQPPKSFGRFTRYLLQKATGLTLPKDGEDIYDTIHLSPEFARTGGPYPYRHRQRDKKLVVNIPSGTRSGQRIRLAQMGALGKNGGIAGDLYLKVKLKKPLLEKAKDFVVSTFSR
jgi:curved DNA-binding protein CbpA